MSRVGFVCTCKKCGSDEIIFVKKVGGIVRCLRCGTIGGYDVFRARRYRKWEQVDLEEPKDLGG